MPKKILSNATCTVRTVRVSAGSPSGMGWSLYKCVALWRAAYGPAGVQQKAPLELFVKSKEFLPGSGFLSRRDMT